MYKEAISDPYGHPMEDVSTPTAPGLTFPCLYPRLTSHCLHGLMAKSWAEV